MCVCITWDSSVECTWISELMFTSELEPSIVRFKLQPVIQLKAPSVTDMIFNSICSELDYFIANILIEI